MMGVGNQQGLDFGMAREREQRRRETAWAIVGDIWAELGNRAGVDEALGAVDAETEAELKATLVELVMKRLAQS